MVLGPAATASLWNMLEMQILRLLRPQIVPSEALGVGPRAVFTSLPHDGSNLRIIGPARAHITGRVMGYFRSLWKADVVGRGDTGKVKNVGGSLQGTA